MKYLAVLAMLLALLALSLSLSPRDPQSDFRFAAGTGHVTLDPQKVTWTHDGRITNALYQGLTQLRVPSLELEPGVAQRWTVSDDGRTYTFFLRSNAKWSNGDPVTAADFHYAWRRALMPDHGCEYANLLYCIEGAEAFFNWRQQQTLDYTSKAPAHTREAASLLLQQAYERFDQSVGIRVVDSHTLEVRLHQPVPYFLELAAFTVYMPVHRASLEASVRGPDPLTGLIEQDSRWTRPPGHISNGPYRLAMWDPKGSLHMVAQEHYWDKAAMRNRSVLEKIIENQMTRVLALERGEVDWVPDLPTTSGLAANVVESHLAGRRQDVHTSPAAGTYFYQLNCRATLADGSPNPLKDVRVRRALALAIDRKVIVEQVTRMHQPVARTFVPPGSLRGYEPPVGDGAGFEPEEARRLLAEAGYAGGRGLQALEILYNTAGGHERIAQEIRSQWRQHLGFDCNLRAQEAKVFQETRNKGRYTITRSSWYGDYRDATTFLQYLATGDGLNSGGYSNPQYDALLQSAAKERDEQKRWRLLEQAEALMLRDQPIIPLYHYINLELWREGEVSGLAVNPWNRLRLEQVATKRSAGVAGMQASEAGR